MSKVRTDGFVDAVATVGEDAHAQSTAYPATVMQPRALALDVGSVRIGVAISSPFGSIAHPLVVLARRDRPLERIAALVEEYEVAQIVVGQPLRFDGAHGPAVVAIEGFVKILQEHLQRQVIWWDERLSTRAAERTMIALGARRKERKENIDKVAAALILQSFLDAGRPEPAAQ